MINSLQKIWNEKPIVVVMAAAIFVRFFAIIFSKGFGMHDDHFLIIETAQAWVDGIIIPGTAGGQNVEDIPAGYSIFYMGMHYLLFKLFAFTGIVDPQFKMLIVRFLHAVASVASVWFAYKITEVLSTKKDAALAGMLMAVLWFLPMMGVRNLVEVFCFPFLLAATWLIVRYEKKSNTLLYYILAGFILGLGMSIRFQVMIFAGGIGLVLLLQKKWWPAIFTGIGILSSFSLVQGLVDYKIWGYPFAGFVEYIRYNLENANAYLTGPWYQYILLLAGILLPPVSLMLLFGFTKIWKQHLIIFLPSLLFLVFHSIFPNKQERFIFPIVPFLIIGGVIGWNKFVYHSGYWKKHSKAISRSWVFFWILNLILLIPVTVAYSKKSRVEAMQYLQHYPNLDVILAEDLNRNSANMLPRYYSKQWMQLLYKSKSGVRSYMADSLPCKPSDASFVLFYSNENLDNRVDSMKIEIPSLQYETTIKPGFVDVVMHKLNPMNRNETIYIYRNTEKIPNRYN